MTILGVTCLVLLFFGHIHWKDSITKATTTSNITEPSSTEVTVESPTIPDTELLLSYANNWPEESKQNLEAAIRENRIFKILIIGSPAIGVEATSWPSLFKQEMENTYGNSISIVIKTFEENTEEFIQENKQEDIIKEQADLIIWEPFTLADNGEVVIEKSHENITTIIQELQATKPNTQFILQPPNPIYQPKLYLTQVNTLETFAQANSITYLNHWENWPDPNSDAILEYITEDNAPNEQGHQVWANFLFQTFINK
jgi:phosphoribosyl-ATP pyrophosphohydrolase